MSDTRTTPATSWGVQCSNCSRIGPRSDSMSGAVELAENAGWRTAKPYGPQYTLCPSCAKAWNLPVRRLIDLLDTAMEERDSLRAELAAVNERAKAGEANALLQAFYTEVCAEAERIMATSGMVSGAHWNAMKIVLKRQGVQIDEVVS